MQPSSAQRLHTNCCLEKLCLHCRATLSPLSCWAERRTIRPPILHPTLYLHICPPAGDQYWIGGCVLLHAIPMYAAMAGEQQWC